MTMFASGLGANSMPKIKKLSGSRSSVVSILDVGTTKVCCMIARLRPKPESEVLPGRTHNIEVLGIGHQRSMGIKAGVVVDLDAAEQAIRNVVDAAERMAGIAVDSLIVNLSAGRLTSSVFNASVDLSGHVVQSVDIDRVLAAGGQQCVTEERATLHAMPVGYTLDGHGGISDPRGLLGEELGIDMHVVTSDIAPMANLELCINRAMLSVETMVATPYASGLSALVGDEAEIGCACIDMGGGTTTFSVFSEGNLIHVDALALGGNHVTMDIARGLSCSLDDAERLKTRHASAIQCDSDEQDILQFPILGEADDEAISSAPKSALNSIVRPRIEETLETVRDRIANSGYSSLIGKRVVLTGGASQLQGVSEVARRILGRNVRLGRPVGVTGLPEAAKSAAFSSAIGLLIYPQVGAVEQAFTSNISHRRTIGLSSGFSGGLTGTVGTISKMGKWIKESF